MDITSFLFFVFVTISLLIYWKLPQGSQWILLLIDSLIFYCLNADLRTMIYLLFSACSVYLATNYFQEAEETGKRRCILCLVIGSNIGILAVLKYTNLFIRTCNFMIGGGHETVLREVNWLQPLAVSFYTLQILSYLLDCYWGLIKPEKNPLKLILFISYFPQMVSGPISRYSDIGSQLFEKHSFCYDRVVHGLKRVAWGLMKKLAVSNRVAVVVSAMWEYTATYSGFWVWVAAAGFVIQLYTDFSGCMDIVLGVSECFGISLPENFNAPLLSRTTQEFWRRWHIMLGTWLRDYIMNPLTKSDVMVKLGQRCKKRFGKKRGRKIPVYLSMLVLWFFMGLWHGDSWKYVGEGLWFWLVIVSGQVFEKPLAGVKAKLHIKAEKPIWTVFCIVRTYVIVMIGNLFFNAHSLMDALYRIRISAHLSLNIETVKEFVGLLHCSDIGGKLGFLIAAVAFALIFIVDVCKYIEKKDLFAFIERHKVIKWIGYYGIVTILVLSLNIGMQEFAYAQF